QIFFYVSNSITISIGAIIANIRILEVGSTVAIAIVVVWIAISVCIFLTVIQAVSVCITWV
ncbi:MAG: hypothetical protein RLN82_06540, partial [Pseudomonadales bacterium]